MSRYFWNILIAFDQFCNACLGGDPDETISSRLGKWARKYKDTSNWRHYVSDVICPILDRIDKNHCEESIEEDEGGNSTFE